MLLNMINEFCIHDRLPRKKHIYKHAQVTKIDFKHKLNIWTLFSLKIHQITDTNHRVCNLRRWKRTAVVTGWLRSIGMVTAVNWESLVTVHSKLVVQEKAMVKRAIVQAGILIKRQMTCLVQKLLNILQTFLLHLISGHAYCFTLKITAHANVNESISHRWDGVIIKNPPIANSLNKITSDVKRLAQ